MPLQTGTAPIIIDNTDQPNPVVEISAATTSASGAVRLLPSWKSMMEL